MSDSALLRVARLLRRAEDAGPEGEAAAREVGRLALHCACLGGKEVQAALMVVRESTGCEVVAVGDRYFAVGTRHEVSDARAACAFLLEAWERAWQESQRPAVRREPAGLFGAGELHVSGDLSELAALFAQSLAPPAPRDREAFLVGLAQGAFIDVVRRRGSQRPPSILARQRWTRRMNAPEGRRGSAPRRGQSAWRRRRTGRLVAKGSRGRSRTPPRGAGPRNLPTRRRRRGPRRRPGGARPTPRLRWPPGGPRRGCARRGSSSGLGACRRPCQRTRRRREGEAAG